jgi:hypothetical protein
VNKLYASFTQRYSSPFKTRVHRHSKYSTGLIFLLIGWILLPNHVFSAEDGAEELEVPLVPATIRLDYVTVDNTFNTPTNPVESTGIVVAPSIQWKGNRRLLEITASYAGKYGSYSESILNFTDHDLRFRLQAELATRHRGFGELVVNQSHEPIGTGQASLTNSVTDQIVVTDVIAQAGYIYGAKTAKGNIGAGIALGTKTFENIDILTDGDDNSLIRPYAFFTYRLSPDTKFHSEIRYLIRDFDDNLRDVDEVTLLTGLDLNPTARTGGSIRFGVSKANFDTAGVPDSSTFVSAINVYYNPRSYSRFSLAFSRGLVIVDNSQNGVGESVQSIANLQWNHNWTGRFSTTASLGFDLIDRDCPNVDTVGSSGGVEFDLSIRRWLSVGAGVGTRNLKTEGCESAIDSEDFNADRTTIGLYVKATL